MLGKIHGIIRWSVKNKIVLMKGSNVMKKTCENDKCKKVFETNIAGQKYCSKKCRKYVGKHKELIHEDDGIPIREFECRECGGRVVIKSEKDRRSVFCCVAHERKYWRHPERYSHRETSNLGMSGGMSLRSLIKRERRDLL